MYQNLCRKGREEEGDLTDGNGSTPILSTGAHWKTLNHDETSSLNWKEFLHAHFAGEHKESIVASEGTRAV